MDEVEKLVPIDAERRLIFFVNGKKVIELSPDPEWTLLWYLRKKLNLTGTKYGCGEGGCGACTVMVSQFIPREERIKHIAVNACLTPLCAMHGLAVTTVEGIGSTRDRLHPVQERLAKAHGSQCGFCTPGIVMSMYALLRNKSTNLDYVDIETALQGNLCRCTGYRPIIEGFKTFIEGWQRNYAMNGKNGMCKMGKECCRNKENEENQNRLFEKSLFQPYDPTQEPIFPPELKLITEYEQSYLYYKAEHSIWIRPQTLDQLLEIKNEILNCKIVVGNTEVGVEVKNRNIVYPIMVYPTAIKMLQGCSVTDDGIVIGATTSLSDIKDFMDNIIKTQPEKSGIYCAITDMLHWFAGNQVRNVASLAGNIVTASPISDMNPILMASSAVINVHSLENGHRKIMVNSDFFKGYRKTAINLQEVITAIEIPFTKTLQFFKAYKQARRRDDDISIVTAAFSVQFEIRNQQTRISDFNICFGGMAPTTISALNTSKVLQGHQWNDEMLQTAFESLTNELQLDVSVPGGMPDYRKSLCLSFFFKFYLHVLQCLNDKEKLNNLRAPKEIIMKEPTSTQHFEIKDNCRIISDSVGLPITHTSALKQATGEAIYCDDMPKVEGELYLCLVFSSESHAKIVSIDASKALQVPGVEAFLSYSDMAGYCNKMGAIFKDEEIFASDIVTSRACVIGAVVATSESVARKAKHLVIVKYEPIHPTILSIEDAIENSSYFSGSPRILKKGNSKEIIEKSPHVVEGQLRTGAQEHFYLETVSAYAIRREDEIEIIVTTQSPAEMAHFVSQTLGIPNHKVVAKVKRIGGGFGGKETRPALLAVPVAFAAYKLRKPVRAVLDREEDMQVTGYRHPCLIKYKTAFDDTGKITAAKFDVYVNAGNSMDISCAMLERIITHVDNCYNIPNIEITGYVCKTNMPSNTAFRGFGAPKAMLAAECLIRDIASKLNKSYEEIANVNMYKENDFTHYNQQLTYCTLSRCWNECIQSSNYWQRKKEIQEFNRSNRWKKKGISLVPTKYGISFQTDFLMQTGVLLLVYNDGSVLLSIGGIEMGQGLFTKMIQVASRALEVDINKIHISEMATDKVPNTQPTAASMSSDLNGMAVINACNVLKERLKPYKDKNPNGTWEDWVMAAYFDRVSLAATGFYAPPKIEYDPETNAGNLFEYFTYGAACSEVIIDCLTGDHQVIRTDIVMDLGESLNPAIDIGQIEGAFTQGYGFYTMEEMLFSQNGQVLSRGPGAYKIPGFSDIPNVFNVSLLKGAPNPRAVYSSKAVGEPPLFLAASIYFAIKEAIRSSRSDSGASLDFTLQLPATCARIRMACEDDITRQVTPTIKGTGKPWNLMV